ncbi:acyl-CoA N-acyltransferase [Irpex rosettiformis]|uniref:Acyl-CoA N-acyltransferase n=1 Tax=Irpex rosettiformis TaxID=378272 RepID=A0ACB8U8X6_9APHY|nr:acyl-CoA N-acyltransferase [Irpex rosettiformis]
MAISTSNVFYDLVKASEIPDAHRIEVASFPPEEAGSLEKFQYRQQNAPDLFLGAYLPSSNGRDIIGYICSTLASSENLTHDSMEEHIPSGTSVCIHAVVVSPEYRKKGIALALLKEYITRLEKDHQAGANTYNRILLICHENLRGLYEKAGFEWLGKSDVVHGPEPWYEMRRALSVAPAPPSQPQAQTLPPGIWEALQRSSSRKVPVARLLSVFSNGVDDVSQKEDSDVTNKHDLLCPRGGCGSIILKNGIASLTEHDSVQIDPTTVHSGSSVLPSLPSPGTAIKWWRISPNAMQFENIEVSRTIVLSETSKRIKLLACAECEIGPLGWHEEGSTEFWLAIDRVGYRE